MRAPKSMRAANARALAGDRAELLQRGLELVRVLLRVALPGAVGGFLGAVVLTNISLASAKAGMSSLLIFCGFVIFARFGLGLRLIPVP